jgi:AcrR family transcriptional regulator
MMLSIQLRMVYPPVLAPVNTVMYGHLVMTDQLSVQDWLNQGLKTLAASGFTALKAEPLAKAMGVSRGSFYWHFADIGAFHAAILNYWRQVAAEEIIADLEAIAGDESPLPVLLRQAFSGKLALERAIRSWATVDSTARNAVQAIDRRRLDYVESLLRDAGFSRETAQARARILYWTFIGFALSDKPLAKPQQEALLNELTRIASPS